MRSEIFSQPWAEAWGRELNASEGYRRAAATWQGSIVMVMRPGEGAGGVERAVFLDLERGRCHDARVATAVDLETAAYRMSASEEVWKRVLARSLDPIWGLMSGRLRLERGSLAQLTPHARAARELVAAAQRVEQAIAHLPADRLPAGVVERFQSTSRRGLDHRLLPMRLWQRAKRIGIWDPHGIDFSRDREDWQRLSAAEQDVLLRLTSLFQAGEEAVTLDLLPLIQVIAAEGRLEEEMYLTSFLWEEAKHVEAFRRFLDEVAHDASDLARYHTPSYRRIFYHELPAALGRLRSDPSPVRLAVASVTYNMIVEGVLAETGYHGYYAILQRHGILPGMQTVVGHLKSDEARHLAYGVFLLSRLVAEHGDPVWQAIEERMGELLTPALEIINEVFAAYDEVPFGLQIEEFSDFALLQFRKRVERVSRARGQRLEEVLHGLGAEEELDG